MYVLLRTQEDVAHPPECLCSAGHMQATQKKTTDTVVCMDQSVGQATRPVIHAASFTWW